MKKQFDNKSFVLYGPDSLKFITDNMEEILKDTMELYKNIFDIEDFRKVTINYFDDKKEFINFIYSIRGKDAFIPNYCKSTFDKGMINSFIDKRIIDKPILKNKRLYNASHELFHIMYRELVLNKYNIKRITWFDEGMAQFFSGENKFILDDNKFKIFLKKVKESTLVIPNLNNLEHGNSFYNENYNGYDLSLLTVKYIYDTLGFNEFKSLIKNTIKIEKYGNMLNDIFKYYDNKGVL